jgi:hypothetical protein
MTTTDNNKIIAEFSGWLKINEKTKNEFWIKGENISLSENLKYNSDWNWLMEVVEKIEGLGNLFVIENTLVNIAPSKGFKDVIIKNENSKIESVYNACLEFIKSHNEQKQ